MYNTALEERINTYTETKKSVSFSAQCKHLTHWRTQSDALARVNAQSLQVTLKRLDLAYAAFFRRVKAGETPSFPRFKPLQRFSGWGYKTHGDGWRLHAGDNMKHGYVRLSSVGMVRLRGKARTVGEVKTCEVQHKSGRWYLSVTVACTPVRGSGTSAMGLGWGLESFATVCDSAGNTQQVENPRFLDQPSAAISNCCSRQSAARRTKARTIAVRRWPAFLPRRGGSANAVKISCTRPPQVLLISTG